MVDSRCSQLGKADPPQYWNDTAYQKFYTDSATERKILNLTIPISSDGDVRRDNCGRKSTSEHDALQEFQRAFAEWSSGKGGVRPPEFRRMLAQVGIDLSIDQARYIWREVVGHVEGKEDVRSMSYSEALEGYVLILEAPVEFTRVRGAAPPGARPLDHADLEDPGTVGPRGGGEAGWRLGGRGSKDEAFEETRLCPIDGEVFRRVHSDAVVSSGPTRRNSGLSLKVGEARELMLDEGLQPAEIEKFLERFADVGSVSHSSLFDYLTSWSAGDLLPGVTADFNQVTTVETKQRMDNDCLFHGRGPNGPSHRVSCRSSRDGLGEYMFRKHGRGTT